MKTYRNKNYTKRDSEATNIVACVSELCPSENFEPCDESELDGLELLFVRAGVRFFGHL